MVHQLDSPSLAVAAEDSLRFRPFRSDICPRRFGRPGVLGFSSASFWRSALFLAQGAVPHVDVAWSGGQNGGMIRTYRNRFCFMNLIPRLFVSHL